MNPVERLPEGIFGPSLSGKTTLARALVCERERRGMRALVLDPHREKWGAHSIVFTDEEKFWATVWEARRCVIVCEEAAATLRRERDLVPAFTRIRHREHKLIVVGHSGTDLLPVMRQQIGTLYLFLQSKSSAEIWAETMADERLMAATQLQQFEFLRKEAYQTPVKMRLSL